MASVLVLHESKRTDGTWPKFSIQRDASGKRRSLYIYDYPAVGSRPESLRRDDFVSRVTVVDLQVLLWRGIKIR